MAAEITRPVSDKLWTMRIFTNEERSEDGLSLCADGETGTWRLHLIKSREQGVRGHGYGDSVDLSLDGLKELYRCLGAVLIDVEKYPDMCNAEVKHKAIYG